MKIQPLLFVLVAGIWVSGCVSDAAQAELLASDSALNVPGVDTFMVGKRDSDSDSDTAGRSAEQMEVDTAADNIRREIFGTGNREEELSTNTAIEKNPDVGPYFPGGTVAMDKFIAKNLIYPLVAFQNDISGTVQIRFVVETDGRISGIGVQRGLGYGCDEAAIDLVKSMPVWTPGKKGGVNVRCSVVLPLTFGKKDPSGY